MKRQTFFLAAMSIMAAFADMGQETIVNVDLSRRPLNGLSWSWTEYSDTSVRLVANRNGDEFCITNWSAYLVLGGGASGGGCDGECCACGDMADAVAAAVADAMANYGIGASTGGADTGGVGEPPANEDPLVIIR